MILYQDTAKTINLFWNLSIQGILKKDHYHLADARPTSVYTARIIAYEGLLIM